MKLMKVAGIETKFRAEITIDVLSVPLFGMVSLMICVLCHQTSLVLFINFSRLSSLTAPGLEAPLNSYLEGVLYKFNGWMDGWMDG